MNESRSLAISPVNKSRSQAISPMNESRSQAISPVNGLGKRLGNTVDFIYYTCSLMTNGKLLGERLREFQKLHDKNLRTHREMNMIFRTMDKDINTVRPELMKLQWEKTQYMRYATRRTST